MITLGSHLSRVFVDFVENLYPLTVKCRIKVALSQAWYNRFLHILVCRKSNYVLTTYASFKLLLFITAEKSWTKCLTVNTTFLEAIFQWKGNVRNISDLNPPQGGYSDQRVFLDIKKEY